MLSDSEALSPGLQRYLWFHLQISISSANFKIPQNSEQLLVNFHSQDEINIISGWRKGERRAMASSRGVPLIPRRPHQPRNNKLWSQENRTRTPPGEELAPQKYCLSTDGGKENLKLKCGFNQSPEHECVDPNPIPLHPPPQYSCCHSSVTHANRKAISRDSRILQSLSSL